MDTIEETWEDNPHVVIATVLDDINQPYSCENWADMGFHNNNFIINDDLNIFQHFSSTYAYEASYPSIIYIDHTMTIHHLSADIGVYITNNLIEDMLENCGDLCAVISGDLNYDEVIDILDIIITVNMIMGNEYSMIADLNDDGTVNILDIINLVNIILAS